MHQRRQAYGKAVGMRPFRIVSITYDLYPFDIRVRRLGEAAVSAGFEMEVICVRGEDEPATEVHNDVLIHRLPMNRLIGGALILRIADWTRFMVRAGAAVARLHQERPYDIVIVHNMPDFLVFAALIPKLNGACVVLDVQDTVPELMASKQHGWNRRLFWTVTALQERMSTAFADYVLTVGWPFEQLLHGRGVPDSKMTSVINSADPCLFPRDQMAPVDVGPPTAVRPLVFMYYGTAAKRNGLDIAIRAVALAQREVPHIRLHIMGRGEELPALKQLAHDVGVEETVQFFSPCPSDEIIDFIRGGDIGIIPYRHDGFEELVLPTKAYELAWLRRPIIASDTVAIRSMFRPQSLALCRPSDAESFAQAMIALYRDPALRLRMAEGAAADYEQYRWERVRVHYQQLLFALASRSTNKEGSPGMPPRDEPLTALWSEASAAP